MHRNDLFALKYISEIPYLLPTGQAVADMRRSVRLNSTGALIWELLGTEKDMDVLLSECAAYYEIAQNENDSEYIEFRNDISEFVNTLIVGGYVSDSSATSGQYTGEPEKKILKYTECMHPQASALLLKIGGFIVRLHGNPAHFPSEFNGFVCSDADAIPDINVSLITAFPDEMHEIPHIQRPGQGICMCTACREKLSVKKITDTKKVPVITKTAPLINHPDLTVFKYNTGYSLYFNTMPAIIKMEINDDASDVRIWLENDFTDPARQMLFHAIRMPFVFFALSRGCIMLHSASILYRDRIWLFSGPSGTGKSTHTNIWNRLYGTPVINGDLNLIVPTDRNISVCGTPWCGTSGICDNLTHTLGGIIFLKQAPADYCEKLTETEKRLNLLQRLISPLWNEAMLDSALKAVESTAGRVMMCRLCCTPQDSAAYAMKSEIDSHIF